MYLLMDIEDELLPDALREESDFYKPSYTGPEPDALNPMDRLFEKFDAKFGSYGFGALDYSVSDSASSWAEHDSRLRAIGGATARAIKEEGKPLLDGLALNLLKRRLHNGSYSEFAVKNLHSLFFDSDSKKFTSVPLDELLRQLNDPEYWKPLIFRGKSKDFEFAFKVFNGRRRERLIFTASFDDGDAWPTNTPIELTDVRIGKRLGTSGTPEKLLEDDLRAILRDQSRRRGLAKEFLEAPRVRGIKGSIRAIIVRELEKSGVRPGTYSREAFSSGRFSYIHTRTPIRNKKWDLLFHRCKDCGSVEALTVDLKDERQRYTDARHELKKLEAVCAGLTVSHIAPWHRIICRGPISNRA